MSYESEVEVQGPALRQAIGAPQKMVEMPHKETGAFGKGAGAENVFANLAPNIAPAVFAPVAAAPQAPVAT